MHTYVVLTGLVISYSVVQLSFKQGLLSLIPIAFYMDAISPLVYGTSLMMIVSLYCLMYLFRSRFRRETPSTGIVISLLLNFGMISAYTLAASSQIGNISINIVLTIWNLFCSSLVLILVHQFYFLLLDNFLETFGIRIAAEQRHAK